MQKHASETTRRVLVGAIRKKKQKKKWPLSTLHAAYPTHTAWSLFPRVTHPRRRKRKKLFRVLLSSRPYGPRHTDRASAGEPDASANGAHFHPVLEPTTFPFNPPELAFPTCVDETLRPESPFPGSRPKASVPVAHFTLQRRAKQVEATVFPHPKCQTGFLFFRSS